MIALARFVLRCTCASNVLESAMKFKLLSALFVLAALPFSASAASSVDGYQWHKRLLIVFAADASSVPLAQQRAFADEELAQYAERDLVAIEVVGDSVRGASESAAELRSRYGVAAGTFRVLLIGKDGGVKIDARQPVEAGRLFGTIDVMPMRRREVQGL
jgi:hypothetical protein